MNELAFKLWKDLKRPDYFEFHDAIDKMSDKELFDNLSTVNGYGYDIVKNLYKDSETRKRAANKIRNLIKYFPALAAPLLLRKPNNQDDK